MRNVVSGLCWIFLNGNPGVSLLCILEIIIPLYLHVKILACKNTTFWIYTMVYMPPGDCSLKRHHSGLKSIIFTIVNLVFWVARKLSGKQRELLEALAAAEAEENAHPRRKGFLEKLKEYFGADKK